MVTEVRSPIFDPIPSDDGTEPRRERELSQTPAAKRARDLRLRRKQGQAPTPKRGRPAGQRKAPTRKPKSLAPEIAAFLSLVNGALVVSPLGTRPIEAIYDPAVEPTRIGDELDLAEITALSASLDAQCQRSPRFRKYVESVLGAGSGGTLVTVVGLIAARRMARHGILPREIDVQAGVLLSTDISAIANMTAPEPAVNPDTGEIAPDRAATDDDA